MFLYPEGRDGTDKAETHSVCAGGVWIDHRAPPYARTYLLSLSLEDADPDIPILNEAKAEFAKLK
ncbi:MAG: hypothetical protein WB755_07715 [Terriglobales bacterium]